MGKYRDFIDSISTNVDETILNMSDEMLIKLAAVRLAAASLHSQPNTLYCAAVSLYLLLENNNAHVFTGFVDPEEVDWLYLLGMMGDVSMSYIEGKHDSEGFPLWADHATNLLAIILGHEDFQIGEFRYQIKSITTP